MPTHINLTPLQYLDTQAKQFSDLGYSSVRFWFPSIDREAMVCKRLYVDGKAVEEIPSQRLKLSNAPYTRRILETKHIERFDYRIDTAIIGEDYYRKKLHKENIDIFLEAPLVFPITGDVIGMACLIPRDQTKTITDDEKSSIEEIFRDLSSNYAYIYSMYQLKQNNELLNKLNDIDNVILDEIKNISTISPWKIAKIFKLILDLLQVITNANFINLQLLKNNRLVPVSYIGDIPISDLTLDINNRAHQNTLNVCAIKSGLPQYNIGKFDYQIISSVYDGHYIVPEQSKDFLFKLRSFAALPLNTRSTIRGVLSVGSINYDFLDEYNKIAIKYFASKIELILNLEARFVELTNEINNQIEQSNDLRITIEKKMRANVKASFARNTMHEMGNRLSEFRLAWNGLARIIKIDKKTSDTSKHIEQVLDHMTGIVASYRKLNEDTFGKKGDEIINICDAIDEACQLCRMQAVSNNIDIVLRLRDNKTTIKGWKMEFIIVVFNLVQNAIDAMSISDKHNNNKGGRIIVKGEKHYDDYKITVSDEGCGIKPERQSRIFQPDYSTKIQYGGSGTGLSLTEHIVKKYGGTIRLQDSTQGKGSTFKVTIPVKDIIQNEG